MEFDGQAYKDATRRQWDDAAEAWFRWGPAIESWLGEATERMLDLADVRSGTRVLDVAAGAGGQSIAAARRGARVLATDLSPRILEFAQEQARVSGVEIETRTADGEALDVVAGSFDAAICRLGFMYLPERVEGLRQALRALRPGGRLALIAFTAPDRNKFVSDPVGIIRRRAGLPEPTIGSPGPFALANGAFPKAAAAAGFDLISAEEIPAPLRLSSAGECARFERESFGALHEMMKSMTEHDREGAWVEVEHHLRQFEGPEGFVGPCELLLGVGTRS